MRRVEEKVQANAHPSGRITNRIFASVVMKFTPCSLPSPSMLTAMPSALPTTKLAGSRRPSSRRFKFRKASDQSSTSSAWRPQLNEESIAQLSAKMKATYRWSSEPRPFQLECIKAQVEGVDMIIRAPTGSGKTAVAAGPHLHESAAGKITIMIEPLLALQDEMVRSQALRI